MKDVLELSTEILIQAKPEQVWAVLEDSTLLPLWAPMVKSTTGETEKVGAIRACQVEWEGRKGKVVERCVEAIPYQKIMWVMEQGEMKKMFSDIRFGFILEPKQSKSTLLRLDGYYHPRNAFTRLLYALMLRRKLHDMIQTLVGNLKDLIEKRTVASG